MESKGNNKNFHVAKQNKMDEFYTQLSDIEKELVHYKEYFKGKVVFCNCDDPRESNFWKYFSLNFKHLGLKKLISTHFDANQPSYKLEMVSMEQLPIQTPLNENGDFRSKECIDILKESDIVVTNPPFSLFREYMAQLIDNNKQFIIMGSTGATGYNEIFKLFKQNKVWLGATPAGTKTFKTPYENTYRKLGNVSWYTNVDHKKRHEELILYRNYKDNETDYPKYDNYDAININKTSEIPQDYNGLMGVPISFMDKYNPEQFEIIGIARELTKAKSGKSTQFYLNGTELYYRIVIKNRMVKS